MNYPWLAVAVGVLLSVLAWSVAVRFEQRAIRAQLGVDATERALAVEHQLAHDLAAVESLAAAFDAAPDLTRSEFQRLTAHLLGRHRSLRAIGWNLYIRDAERAGVEAAIRAEGFADFRITERAADGRLVEAAKRPFHCFVRYLEPLEGNESAFGFDVASEPARRAALQAAAASGKLRLSSGLRLIQDDAEGMGVLAFWPRFRAGSQGSDLEGFVVGVIQVKDVVEAALAPLDSTVLDVRVEDTTDSESASLFASDVQDPGLAPFEYASSFDAGGRTWRLTFSPTPASIASLETWQPLGTLAGGLCLTAVAVFYVQILRRRTWRIEELARDRSREIDRRIEAERERRRLDAKLQQAQRLESLGVLAGGIAHDFNNLLTTILGNADLLAMQPRDNQRGDEAAQIRLAALRAAELTQQMLAYSGRGSFTTSPVDLSEVVQEIVQLLASSVSKKAELRCALAPDLPMIAADGSQIRQVVMNLVTNASEALGSEPGVVDVSTGFRWFEAEELQDAFGGETVEPGEKVYLEVSDTGCGMDARALERLFDPFFTTKREGRGLGLAAALGIVRSHSGSIHCTSRVGEGTRFRVLFPGSDLEKPKREEAPSTLGWQGGRTILVVDDDGPVRALATRLLEGLGFHVRSANDGAAGVEAFRRFADEIDVVLLDMTMPVMGGGEALAAIRSIRADARIVVSSGYDKQDSLANLGTGRPDAFLQKPFTQDALAQALRDALPDSGMEARTQ